MDYSLITKEQIKNRFELLPEKLKQVLTSDFSAKKLRDICKANGLDKDETLVVEQLVVLRTILGFIRIDEMSSEIVELTFADQELADRITEEIKRQILAPIRDEIKYIPIEPIKLEERENLDNTKELVVKVAEPFFILFGGVIKGIIVFFGEVIKEAIKSVKDSNDEIEKREIKRDYFSGEATYIGNRKIQRDWEGKATYLGDQKIQRDWEGKATYIGDQKIQRDYFSGKITYIGDQKIDGDLDID